MKILVCIKQIPDLESRFRPNAAGTWYSETDLAFRMNEYDEYAVEQAVRVKESLGDAPEVTVISIGPDRVAEALKKALAMGCDRAVHIQDPAAHEKDPWQVSGLLAAFARDKGFDLIFTGLQSQDRGSAQVGVLLAERLGLASVTTAVGFALEGGTVTVQRELEGGLKAALRLPLPALVTCQLGLNTPRYPTLPNLMKAKKKELLGVPVSSLEVPAPLSETCAFHAPAKGGSGVVLEGDVKDQAEQLVAILRSKTPVLR